MCGGTVALGPLTPKIQPFIAINPVHPLVVVHEAFPSQKDMDAPKPITSPYRGYLVHVHAQQFFAPALGLVIEHALMQQYQLATTLNGDIIFHPNIGDHPSFSGRP